MSFGADCCATAKPSVLGAIAKVLTGILCASNLAFMFAVCLLMVLIIVDVIIGLMFQVSLAPSVGAAFACSALNGVAYPWLGALLATIVDWRRWPVRYGLLLAATRELFGIDDRASGGNNGMNARRLAWYSAPLLITITTTFIGIGGGKQTSVGTILFIALSVCYCVVNACFDVITLAWRDAEDSSLLFMLFGKQRGVFPMVAMVFTLLTNISVVAQDPLMVRGGTAATVISMVVTIAFFGFHAWAYFTRLLRFEARSQRTLLLAVIETLSLLVAGILVATSFSPRNSTGVWVALVSVMLTYGTLYYLDTALDLDDGGVVVFGRSSTAAVDVADVSRAPGAIAAAAPAGHTPREQQMHSAVQLNDTSNAAGGDGGGGSAPTDPTGSSNDSKEHPLVARCSDAAFSGDEMNSHTGDMRSDLRGAAGNIGAGAADARQLARGEEHKLGQRTSVLRIANVCMGATCFVVLVSSLINTGGDSHAASCPGYYPGTNSTSDRFTVCDVRFDGNLTVIDFASLAAASYMSDANFDDALRVYFPSENATKIGGDTADDAFIGIRFYTVRFPRKNVTAVIIRGSASASSWMQDTYLGSDALTLQVGMSLLPVFFSEDLQATLVQLISSLKFGLTAYTVPVAGELTRVKALHASDTFYTVGHSLGGFTCNVVGAQTNTKSVAFSPIGIGLQKKRFNFEWSVADRVITSVVPMSDIVPKIDIQLGSVQNIVSDEPCGTKNALCHSLALTFRSLASSCGDPLGRMTLSSKMNKPCA